ncbi:hypothetical protein BDP27DRAFT_1367366 [Rhodocollybia butyracea]|uniref:Uncharacterized protein n=1 Tax=Rhodocollybia butyracea TaxID=206335 RepID=A0A9P5PIY0_9AGAR|nr:hypothetical protein BDP27DRAFT_1367366 [Rhodocollybia butyracea]
MDSGITTSAPHHEFILYILVTIDPSRIDEYLEHLRPIHKAVSSEPDSDKPARYFSRKAGIGIGMVQRGSSEERILSTLYGGCIAYVDKNLDTNLHFHCGIKAQSPAVSFFNASLSPNPITSG